MAIQDAGYNYLELSSQINDGVQPGDKVVTPGNSQGGDVVLNTAGKVIAIGPERIEINNPVYHGNSGGPVFHAKSSKVLGVVTEARKVDATDEVDKASLANRNSAISGDMRYFALRIDTIQEWISVDWSRFQTEALYLDQFHLLSQRIADFISSDNSSSGNRTALESFAKEKRIVKALNNFYANMGGGSDTASQIAARRTFVFEINAIVDLNLEQIKNVKAFYPFNQARAQKEADFRTALKEQVDGWANNVERMRHLPRTNSSASE